MSKNNESNIKLTIHAKGINIGISSTEFGEKYISMSDIAKFKSAKSAGEIINNWMRSKSTMEFLFTWEKFYNPNFKLVEFDKFKKALGNNFFRMSPKKWVELTGSLRIISKSGRYGGGVYAHSDIAFEFASWISPEFKLYIIKEYQRLKINETKEQYQWNLKREISKLNYDIHTDAIKERLLPFELTDDQLNKIYASEADILNVALFGKTANEWKNENPEKDGNLRDFATIEQLLVLSNLESYNSILIEQGLTQSERLKLLRKTATKQLKTILKSIEDKPKGLLN